MGNDLLRCLERPENNVVIHVFLRAVETCGLSFEERRYLVYRFLRSPEALHAAGDDGRRVRTVKVALNELESILNEMKKRRNGIGAPKPNGKSAVTFDVVAANHAADVTPDEIRRVKR